MGWIFPYSMDIFFLKYRGVSFMSAKVRILSEQLANKIAAGEVVERPASVVKELVENSLDAGATEVIIEIEDGGKRLIRVTDNGSGMSREDSLLSLERHATSKISSDSDLFSLHTLGFRGEAIPSIASVCRITLSSREAGNVEGVEIYAEGGKIKDVKACGMPVGTFISVRNLFFNTPARLKFMRSRETESGHISEIIYRLALSRPEVRFIYSVDSKPVLNLLSGNMTSRTREVLGKSLANEMHLLKADENGISLQGLLGSPSVNRSTASSVYTFINGRYIRDRVVQHAILQAYRNVLERGRYPALVLFIDISPEDVDVNVHPTKHEVRFREQAKVHQTINGAIEVFLRMAPWLGGVAGNPILKSSRPVVAAQNISRIEEVRDSLLRYAITEQPLQKYSLHQHPVQAVDSEPFSIAGSADKVLARTSCDYSDLQVIGQFRASYILCQDESELVIIDQHAAHERVVFEELRRSFSDSALERQQLLFPETLELLPDESAVLKEQLLLISRFGFDVEHFGGTTWLLSSVPISLSGLDYMRVLRDLLEEMAGIGSSRLLNEKFEDMLATIACHSVVRGERHLSLNEIKYLFERMDNTDFSAHCPHGRPAVSRISLKDIEKLFNRT